MQQCAQRRLRGPAHHRLLGYSALFACIANTQESSVDKVSAPQKSDGIYAQVLDTGMAMQVQRDDREGKGLAFPWTISPSLSPT